MYGHGTMVPPGCVCVCVRARARACHGCVCVFVLFLARTSRDIPKSRKNEEPRVTRSVSCDHIGLLHSRSCAGCTFPHFQFRFRMRTLVGQFDPRFCADLCPPLFLCGTCQLAHCARGHPSVGFVRGKCRNVLVLKKMLLPKVLYQLFCQFLTALRDFQSAWSPSICVHSLSLVDVLILRQGPTFIPLLGAMLRMLCRAISLPRRPRYYQAYQST
jgi:hypothetical protein